MKPLGGDAAREIGTFTLKTKGDKPQEVAGKYVVGLGEDPGGQWKLATDIWMRTSRAQALRSDEGSFTGGS